jgi:hypothetical protein
LRVLRLLAVLRLPVLRLPVLRLLVLRLLVLRLLVRRVLLVGIGVILSGRVTGVWAFVGPGQGVGFPGRDIA